jgi:hypothetical protein
MPDNGLDDMLESNLNHLATVAIIFKECPLLELFLFLIQNGLLFV